MLTKAALATEIRKSAGLSYREAALCLDVLIESFARALSRGERIELRGLGAFEVKARPEKNYPSLMSNRKTVPAHGRIMFRPSQKLREAVWGLVSRS